VRETPLQVAATLDEESGHTWDTRTPESRVNRRNKRNKRKIQARISRIEDKPPVVGPARAAKRSVAGDIGMDWGGSDNFRKKVRSNWYQV
jgi:hypothetical protein